MSSLSTPDIITATEADLAAFDALFAHSSAIGTTANGGLHRLAASAEDGAMRDAFCAWLGERGFEVRVDAVGNVFGLVTFNPSAPYVLCGSHLDSQPNAGRFDGTYGVLAGAVAVASVTRQLRERGETPAFNLAVVNWTNEEGARFQPSLIGSSTFMGSLSVAEACSSRDAAGITLGDALAQIGYRGEAMLDVPVAAYLELHVEQGSQLENQGLAIGVVRHTWAALKWRVRFDGEQNHTGPAPMAVRRDALLAAAHAIVAVKAEAELHGLHMHSSVGRLEVEPNSPNVVPALARLLVEFRSPSTPLLAAAGERFRATLADIAARTGTTFEIEHAQLREPSHLHHGLSELAHATCAELALPCGDSVTVAGHDAISLSRRYPTSLLFVPSQGGLSHNEAEFTATADLHRGVRLLTALLYRACCQPGRYLGGATS
ncbi:Zn-dependent hydrolase [Pseudomonas typographi]|uniref:Zn-dependent hydrolase n=1 Tax=Pseudomonas typographi TaxID=2715964 RepID=A0ABR7Z1M7_9PSED|nr:Zn-dependent hydrolase [Pseudomonas typographi]MBD1551498.1 Zn-dependent hydrolase [Pseudomonas typographi]MBD1587516.1 Zn-dependent hydrolase [Pseudomonas typographi]MBD1599401.1 Zn-dependent hydrolase [Pseudomonas typographi]